LIVYQDRYAFPTRRSSDLEVADALINKISSFTKIEYIRMFSQLKSKIEKDVQDIQDAIANGADYVAEMKTEREQGVKEINKTVTDRKSTRPELQSRFDLVC